MHDRGEKIVTLARELLRSDDAPKTENSAVPRNGLSLRILCLATVLTALGSSAVTQWVGEIRRPINRYEKTELDALVFYAARIKGLDEDALRRDVLEQLKVPSFDDMTEREFLIARRYLQGKAS